MTRILNAETLTSHGNVRGRKALVEILEAGLQAADPYYTTRSMLHLDGDMLTIRLKVSDDGGQTYNIIPQSVRGDIGENIAPGTGKVIVWDVSEDMPGVRGDIFRARVIANDAPPVIIGKDGAEMVLIPAGEFEMGNHYGTGDGDENPVHTVYLDDYYIDIYEVTNVQYAQFLNDYGKNTDNDGNALLKLGGDCLIEAVGGIYSPKAGYEDHPVVMVSWYGATAFCNYYGWRLPAELEWQAVADYDGTFTYGCGTTINQSKANYNDNGYANPLGLCNYPYTSPVNHYSCYGYGMNDMAGNVWEWTSTVSGGAHIIRGGAWNYGLAQCNVSWRYDGYPSYALYIGFRVCR